MKRSTRPNLAARFAAVSLGTALLVGSAGAAMAQTTPATTTNAAAKAAKADARGAAKTAARTAELTALAGRLGVTVEKLQQALTDQAAADKTKMAAQRQANQAAATTATKTRKSATEIQAAADARATELAGRLGVTKDTLVNAVKDQAKVKVDADLTAGYITTAQAAARKAMIDANPSAGLGGGKGGHRGGMDGGRGGMGGGKGGRH